MQEHCQSHWTIDLTIFMTPVQGGYAALRIKNTDFEHNIPVIMALMGIWNCNFLGAHTEAIYL